MNSYTVSKRNVLVGRHFLRLHRRNALRKIMTASPTASSSSIRKCHTVVQFKPLHSHDKDPALMDIVSMYIRHKPAMFGCFTSTVL